MSIQAVQQAFNTTGVNAIETLVLMDLAQRVENSTAQVNIPAIARSTRISQENVLHALSTLADQGLLNIHVELTQNHEQKVA